MKHVIHIYGASGSGTSALGSYHPEHKDMYYPVNYGYVEGIMAPDGEEQDAYILGVDEAVDKFTGNVKLQSEKRMTLK